MIKQLIGVAALATAPLPSDVQAIVETVSTETAIAADMATVWSAVRDVYAVDQRLMPGMVTKVERQGEIRKVTFANGIVVTERIVAIDDATHTITYAAIGSKATYHRAMMQVVADANGATRVIWRTDFLPAELRPFITQNMERGSAVMKRHLERGRATRQH